MGAASDQTPKRRPGVRKGPIPGKSPNCGGARPGGGRPIGAVTIRSKEIAQQYLEKDVHPLKVMLDNMVFWDKNAASISRKLTELIAGIDTADIQRRNSKYRLFMDLVQKLEAYRDKSQFCASQAAPYMHPKLQSIVLKGDRDNPIYAEITAKMSPKEAAEAYANALAIPDEDEEDE